MFLSEGLALDVWSGMTLHHVRKYLVGRGIMERCKPEIEAKNPLIVALDGKEWREILPLLDLLRTTGCIFKVNDLLFWEGYKSLVPDLQVYGRVMVDLKGHDIPNTLGNISQRFAKNPPWAVTVHGSGQEEMIKKVVEAFKGTPTKVLVVTVLTSLDKKSCEEVYVRQPLDQVKKLAEIASRAGAHGLVSSPEEVGELKSLYPHMDLVPAGVRSPGADQGDQKRIGTPCGVLEAGGLVFRDGPADIECCRSGS
jgi:orotidine-5'-phosphate decarboxylase